MFIVILGLAFWCLKKIKLRSSELASRSIRKQTTRMKTDLDKSKVYFSVPVFSYSELEEATNKFDPSRELGVGGFGTVYYGKKAYFSALVSFLLRWLVIILRWYRHSGCLV